MKKQFAIAAALHLLLIESLSADPIFLACPDKLNFTPTGTPNTSNEYNINIDATLSGMQTNGFAWGTVNSEVSDTCKLSGAVGKVTTCTLSPASVNIGPESDNPFLSCMYSVSKDSSINPAPIALVTTTDALNKGGYKNCQVATGEIGFNCDKH